MNVRVLAGRVVAIVVLPALPLAGMSGAGWQGEPAAIVSSVTVRQGPRLELKPGLALSYVSSLSGEPDYEDLLVVEKADTDAALLRSSWNRGPDRRWKTIRRPLSRRERLRARAFYYWGSERDTSQHRGYAFSMGTAPVLSDLKRAGRADVVVLVPEETPRTAYRGTLERVGARPEAFQVILDGKQVSLPGIRARGTLTNLLAPDPQLKMEFVFLDDPETPWYLDSRMEAPDGRGGRKLLVRIATSSGDRNVADELRTRCETHVNDIYFATASAEMDSASLPAIARIAAALKEHRDWQLTIVGHTDSIGAAAANLALSQRRSEAVRTVLVRDQGIAAGRLKAEGRGETEPIADDGTLQGRARNRRVDLKRKCD